MVEQADADEHQEGYFENRIKKYLTEYHLDLVQDREFETHVSELTQDAITLFQAFDRAGMSTYEAMERALTETLESATSPYSILKEFLLENQAFLMYATGIEDLDEQDLVMHILFENAPIVSALQMATTPVETVQANKDLLSGIRKTLLRLNKI